MFLPDKPIKSRKDDFLRRAPFARSLGQAMLSYKDTDSLVVGLFGTWGSGKTSIINMILEYMGNTGSPEMENTPLIIRFNPWNFSAQNQMIPQFFNHLFSAVGKIKADDIEILKEKLIIYKNFFSTRYRGESDNSEIDFHNIRDELDGRFEKQPHKIIIFVDDIDRLNTNEVLEIFRLMKVIANFPNTIYMASFDKEAVIRALNKVQEVSGVEYLEKIIQVPFEVPLISKRDVEEYLLKRIAGLLKNIPSKRFDNTYWGDVYHSGLKNFFHSIRDVTRYINALKFSFEMVKREINIVDFLVIISLQVFASDVFSGIRDNKELFTGIVEADSPSIPRDRERILKVLNSSPVVPAQLLISLLGRVFPKLDTVINDVIYEEGQLVTWRQEGRVCSSEIFDIFFRLTVPEGKVSRSEIKDILSHTGDPAAFADAILKSGDREKVGSFLLFLEDSVALQVPGQFMGNVISAFMNIGDSFINPETGDISTVSQIIDIQFQLLSRMESPEERYEILKSAIEYSDKSLFTLVKQVEKVYPEIPGDEEDEESIPWEKKLITKEQAEKLVNKVCEKIESWAEDGRLLKHVDFADILIQWMKWRKPEQISGYIVKLIESDSGLIDFISGITKKSLISGVYDISLKRELMTNIHRIKQLADIGDIENRLRRISSYRGFIRLDKKKRAGVKEFLKVLGEKEKGAKPREESLEDLLAKVNRAKQKIAEIERARDERVRKGIVVGEEDEAGEASQPRNPVGEASQPRNHKEGTESDE